MGCWRCVGKNGGDKGLRMFNTNNDDANASIHDVPYDRNRRTKYEGERGRKSHEYSHEEYPHLLGDEMRSPNCFYDHAFYASQGQD